LIRLAEYKEGLGTSEKPTAAFVLSLIAAIFILLNGVFIAIIGAIIFAFAPGFAIVLAAIGLVFGIIVLVGAILLWTKPEMHKGAGILVLLFSIFSLVIGGGFFIGFILGLVGGILAIVWKAPAPMAPGMAPPMMPPSMPPS
jgi:Family of unknown function (DUF6114)